MHRRVLNLLLGLGLLGIPLYAAADEPSAALRIAYLPSYTTPKAVAHFLEHEFTFTRDEEQFAEADHWQTPEEFLARRAGDCEDYAVLAQALLQRQGITSYIVSLLGDDGYAHTVNVFLDSEGRYDVINEGHLRNYHAATLEAAASAVNPSWTVAMIAVQEGTHGRIVRELYNEHPALTDLPDLPF